MLALASVIGIPAVLGAIAVLTLAGQQRLPLNQVDPLA